MNEGTTSNNTLFDTGSVIDDKWVVIERIGKGGMGEVFRAHQLNLRRDVAIKVISEDILQDVEDNPDEVTNAMKRLHIEVQAMARVRHPNVLQIYDFGSVTDPRHGADRQVEYIVMEYVPGNTFRHTMSEEGFGEETELLAAWLRDYFLPVLDGLEAIHAHDIVHRDIKPENIFMDGDTPKIADFGLARSPKMKAVSDSWEVKGTMPYMAPEQFAEFRRAGFAADVYALGKILYEAVAGKLDPKTVPFKSASLENPDSNLLKTLDGIIRKATDENFRHRYQRVSEMRNAILDALASARKDPPPFPSPVKTPASVRWLWAGIVAVLFSVGGMTIYHMVGDGSGPPAVTSESDTTTAAAPEHLTENRVAEDGRRMTLIKHPQEGLVFYADPSLVTFHHYVEFLNEVRPSLNVTDGVVRKGDDIWVYLGDGGKPSDQIVYRHGRFHLRDTQWAARPVVRVTWLGARAYASHYGKRLPSHVQWRALQRRLPIAAVDRNKSATGESMQMHMEMHQGPQTANQSQTQTAVVKEWLIVKNSESGPDSRVADSSVDSPQQQTAGRYAWEGFDDVGFRTVMTFGDNFASAGDGRGSGQTETVVVRHPDSPE